MISKAELFSICEQCYLQMDKQEEIILSFLNTNELKYDSLMWIEFYNSDSVGLKYDIIKTIIQEL